MTGDVRQRKALIKNAGEREVLITSYDLLKRDLKTYQKLDFAVQIIDEAQYIKKSWNPGGKGCEGDPVRIPTGVNWYTGGEPAQ